VLNEILTFPARGAAVKSKKAGVKPAFSANSIPTDQYLATTGLAQLKR